MHVLQNAYECNWYGPGSTNTSPKERMRKRRTKKPAKEVVVVDDEEDEEGEKEKETRDGEHANVTRPGVGHGVLTQLGES